MIRGQEYFSDGMTKVVVIFQKSSRSALDWTSSLVYVENPRRGEGEKEN